MPNYGADLTTWYPFLYIFGIALLWSKSLPRILTPIQEPRIAQPHHNGNPKNQHPQHPQHPTTTSQLTPTRVLIPAAQAHRLHKNNYADQDSEPQEDVAADYVDAEEGVLEGGQSTLDVELELLEREDAVF